MKFGSIKLVVPGWQGWVVGSALALLFRCDDDRRASEVGRRRQNYVRYLRYLGVVGDDTTYLFVLVHRARYLP